jgi:hypothetical protein
MILSGYNTYMYDVCFNHPDDSSFYTYVAFVDDNPPDYEEDPQEYAERVCREIWNKYNSSNYYHDMEISHTTIIDNTIYTTHTRYNGFEAEILPTEVKIIEG